MENRKHTKLQQAKQKVQRLKSFYNHLAVFILINGALLLLKNKTMMAIFGKEALGDSRLMHWVDINVYIWLGVLVIHAIVVFGDLHDLIKKWEDRQVEKIMQKDAARKYE
ncbi:MAG: 2TM domain-containing protein [Maribacter sp.]|uniref:2TM domain-containing protein n=1 Tax=Maribacter sp. TaxID=1897614 RepID=UPI0032975FA1